MSPFVLWLIILAVFLAVFAVGWAVNAIETQCREARIAVSAAQRSRREMMIERVRQEAYFGQWWR